MPIRRNIAHLTPAEREQFVDAIRQIDLLAYPDGVSYWDKQDQIHQGTHNHGGNSFIPWHRELCNRFEKLLQQVDPDVALHYWDWTEDPRAASDGSGGTVDICTNDLMGTANGLVAGTLAPLHNGDVLAGSRDATGDPADPPRAITRNCPAGAAGISPDTTIIHSADAPPQTQQWTTFRTTLESAHDSAHLFFGFCTNIWHLHSAFEDPFVFLLHANVDRLFAMWQAEPGQEGGSIKTSSTATRRTRATQRASCTTSSPGTGPSSSGLRSGRGRIRAGRNRGQELPSSVGRHSAVLRHAAPDGHSGGARGGRPDPVPGCRRRRGDRPGAASCARGCTSVTWQRVAERPSSFSLLASSVSSPAPNAFETHDVLVWVIFTPGGLGSTRPGRSTSMSSRRATASAFRSTRT